MTFIVLAYAAVIIHVTLAGDCPMESGFCVLPNGGDQNSGVVKLDSADNYNQISAKQDCLSRCIAYNGATGCEVIWNQGNRGCYVHTATIARGNNVDRHNCWVFSKCSGDCSMESGFCVLPNGGDQNSGVVKLDSGNNYDQTSAKQDCLTRCLAYDGATGCEVIWNQNNRGCYVHTATIDRGNNVDRHNCWVFSKCGGTEMENGFCVLSNGGDQNSGVLKLDSNANYNRMDAKLNCLARCREHGSATGCEVIWDQGNRGCYVHTGSIDRGNNVARHNCWVFPSSDCPMENGYCVLPNGGDQNSGVVKLDSAANYDQTTAKQNCLSRCLAYDGATGCEVIWNQGNRGCYVHTGTIARGNNVDRHNCWVFSKCGNPQQCVDFVPSSASKWYDSDGQYYDCEWYGSSSSFCSSYGHGYSNFGRTANTACCTCGGGSTGRRIEAKPIEVNS